MMTVIQATRELCSIMGLAQKSIRDFEHPNDGVCDLCRGRTSVEFENSGKSIEYVRAAVVDALRRDGHTIAKGFDPVTGATKESCPEEEDNFPEPDIVENGMTREQAEREYQQGKAEGERYSAERKIYGDRLADLFAAQDEMNRYNAGDDY